jgi:hypothetical protein
MKKITLMAAPMIVMVTTIFALFFATPANADGILTSAESAIVAEYPQATCGTMDDLFDGNVDDDTAYLAGILAGMSEHYGITADNAMDVVNEQVFEYCPRHWDNLVAIGQNARAYYAQPTLKHLI